MLGLHGSTKPARAGLAMGDILCLNGVYLVLHLFTWEHALFDSFRGYWLFLLAGNLSWIVSAYSLRVYGFYRTFGFTRIIRQTVQHLLLYFVLVGAFIGFTGNYDLPGRFFLILFSLQGAGVLSLRFLSLSLLRVYRRTGHNFKRVAIAGIDDNARELRHLFHEHPEHGYRFLGYYDDERVKDQEWGGTLQDLKKQVKEREVDEVFCALSRVGNQEVLQLSDIAENNLVRIKFLSKTSSLYPKSLRLRLYEGLPLLHFRPMPLDDRLNMVCKRGFDLFFSSLVILFVLSWLLPLIALIIRIDSRGPIFFKQKRSGIRNRPFWCYKLRTMYVNGEADTQQATEGDPRITPVGDFLRKTSMDELPQFFNVFMGDMSVVGPRPHMLKHTEEYADKIDKFMVRHLIKPGITGLSQVKGYRGPTETIDKMNKRARIDRFYVENWSFLLDLKIVYQTVAKVFQKEEEAV